MFGYNADENTRINKINIFSLVYHKDANKLVIRWISATPITISEQQQKKLNLNYQRCQIIIYIKNNFQIEFSDNFSFKGAGRLEILKRLFLYKSIVYNTDGQMVACGYI